MPIEEVAGLAAFERLRERWENMYDRDPHAHVFLSWPWIRAQLAVERRRWFILAVRDERGEPVAFLPLAKEAFPQWGPRLDRDLHLAGSPAADFTGLLALPEYEERALPELADYLQRLPWGMLKANDVLDERVERLLQFLPRDEFRILARGTTGCPFIRLPATWDEYLEGNLSKRFRQNLRASMQNVQRLPRFRVEFTTAGNVDKHIDLCIRFAQTRYPNSRAYREQQRALLTECFKTGCLWSCVLWSGEHAVAALSALTDGRGRDFSIYKFAFNSDYARVSPGTAVLGLTIRHAIAQGFQTYDFLRGKEDYKLRFGSEVRYTKHLVATRSGARHAIVNTIRPAVHLAERAVTPAAWRARLRRTLRK